MKLFKCIFTGLLCFTGSAALAGEIFTAYGSAKGYCYSEGAYADCTHSREMAINVALQDCFDAGRKTCTLRHVSETAYGGSCYYRNDYCRSTAVVYGN